jgi:phospholipase/lecithinase/hemolysin
MSKQTWLVLWLAVCFLRVSSAEALNLDQFENLVIFGDSLSDNGNSYVAQGLPPSPPYYRGRWTNGPNWVDYFPSIAHRFAPVTAFLKDSGRGTNFAVGGSPSTALATQIGAFLASPRAGGQASPHDLYVIWIGANDFSAGLEPKDTVSAIGAGIAQLWQAGAKTIVLMDLPDISLTPRVITAGGATVQAAKRFVTTVNVALQVEAPVLACALGIQVELIDVNVLLAPLVYCPGEFEFTNSSGYALDPSTGGGDTNPDHYVSWDGFHPTTRAHHIAAAFFYRTLAERDVFPGARRALRR